MSDDRSQSNQSNQSGSGAPKYIPPFKRVTTNYTEQDIVSDTYVYTREQLLAIANSMDTPLPSQVILARLRELGISKPPARGPKWHFKKASE